MNAPSLAIRKGRKYDDVLAGARQVFMTDGFEGASVDEIAKAAGVSKATLYSYFPDKRLLFIEVLRTECGRVAEAGINDIDMSAPPRDVLTKTAQHFLGFILTRIGQQVFRICVAESDRFPEIGQAFYAAGPTLVRSVLIKYMEGAIERGELAVDDLDLAADQFPELCKADLWIRCLFGIQEEVSQAEIDRIVKGAVDTWLARYGT